jgi:hypothetical protein
MKRAQVMAGLALVVVMGGCGRFIKAPQTNTSGWAVSRTQHVKVYTDAWIEHEHMQEWLELSHSAYQALFPNVRTGTVDAVWLKNQPGGVRFYSPLDDPASGWTLETMPSGGQIGREGLIVLERREEMVRSGDTFAVRSVRDEGLAKSQMAHLFIMKAVPQAPLWLQMGLARYMSRFRIHYKGDYAIACFGSVVFDEPIFSGGGRSGRRVIIPYGELTSTDWYVYDRKRRYWYEYTAYAFIHYLIHGERGFHRQRFPLLLKALAEGKNTDDALALAYPHILPGEWDDRIEAYTHPKQGPARIAENPYIQQGMCLKVPPVRLAEAKPKRSPADQSEVDLMLDDLVRVDPFHRHSNWLPHDVVEAEAAKRPRGPRSPRVPGPGGSGTERPEDEKNPVPTIRSGTSAPPPAPPPPPPSIPPP